MIRKGAQGTLRKIALATSRLPRLLLLGLIRLYQLVLSPILPPACRFFPSCSEYARESIEHFGVLRGTLKAVWRLLKCHPFHPGGYDPVLPDEVVRTEHGPCSERAGCCPTADRV